MGERIAGYLLRQACYWLRCMTHYLRNRHTEKGRDWRFYEQYSISEILKMKFDGSEIQKYDVWCHRR